MVTANEQIEKQIKGGNQVIIVEVDGENTYVQDITLNPSLEGMKFYLNYYNDNNLISELIENKESFKIILKKEKTTRVWEGKKQIIEIQKLVKIEKI